MNYHKRIAIIMIIREVEPTFVHSKLKGAHDISSDAVL